MADNYRELFRIEPNLYIEGSPVIIEAGALHKDLQKDKVLAQLKLRNISPNSIIACKVTILAYEVNGRQLEGIHDFSYLDINARPGNAFGSKTPIYMPDNITRRITALVSEIVFADNSVWHNNLSEWTSISNPIPIEQYYSDTELINQFHIELGQDAKFYPMIERGLFHCTCGKNNMNSTCRCYNCNRLYSDLVNYLDDEFLAEKKAARIKQEIVTKQQAIEQNKKRKRKLKKNAIIIASIFAVILIIFAIITATVIIPYTKVASIEKELLAGNKWGEKFSDPRKSIFGIDDLYCVGVVVDSEGRVQEIYYSTNEGMVDEDIDFTATEKDYQSILDNWNNIFGPLDEEVSYSEPTITDYGAFQRSVTAEYGKNTYNLTYFAPLVLGEDMNYKNGRDGSSGLIIVNIIHSY